jgi:predicted Zn finger-like uncharacterized protein
MKIVCDSCGTKYSISDEKVRGKVFKIRCKKCSHIIVVRGTNEAAAAASAAPAAAAPAAVADGGWHLVVEGDQVGPVPESDIRARIERGEINAETYVWKEGFADWLKLSAIPEFAELVTPADGGVFADGSGSGAVNGDAHAHAPAATGGLFGGAANVHVDEEADVFGGIAPAVKRGGGGDLFAAPIAVAKPAAEESRWPASSAAPAGHDGGRIETLTGQRHENSVLFSLSNLQSLAMPAPAAKSVSSTAPTTEGSGLIDIRAMAATTLGSSNVGSSFGGGSPVDDLPAFGAFSPAAPVLLALPSNSGPSKWVYIGIGVIALLVVGVAVMAVMVFGAKPTPVQTAAAPSAPSAPGAPAAAPSAPVAAATPPPAAAPTTIPDEKLPPREAPTAAAPAAAAKPEHAEHHKGHGEHGAKKGGGDEGKSESKKAVAEAAAAPSPVAEKKPAKGSLDDLLDGALNHKSSGGSAKPRVDEDSARKSESAGGGGPLSKGAVVAGMNSVKGKVGDCYQQFKVPGMAMVNVVIGKSGRVSSATVSGKFAGTPTGACVEKAVKSASFPPSDGFTTPYPFQLR